MELTLVPLLLPAIQRQFDLSVGELTWVFNSYGIAVALGVLLGGWLGDVFNSKKTFVVGVSLFASGAIIVAFAANYETIIIGRILQGLGGGVFSPLIPLVLTQSVPHRPGKVLIVWGSVAGYVAASAPFFYGSFFSTYGWSLAFIVFAVVSVSGLAILNGSQIENNTLSPRIWSFKLTRLLRSRELAMMYGYILFTYGAITYYAFRLPLWLEEKDFQLLSIGFILSILWLSFSVSSTLMRNWVDAPNIRGILLTAPTLIASGFALSYACNDVTCLVLSSVLVGTGLACSNAPSTQLVLRFAPKGMSAISASLDITFARIGGVVAVAVLAQSVYGYAVFAVTLMSFAAFLFALQAVKGLEKRSEG